eukprot:365641-Chlamydomonas_euryale.AAC.1
MHPQRNNKTLSAARTLRAAGGGSGAPLGWPGWRLLLLLLLWQRQRPDVTVAAAIAPCLRQRCARRCCGAGIDRSQRRVVESAAGGVFAVCVLEVECAHWLAGPQRVAEQRQRDL